MRGAIPPLRLYVFMAWCLIKHRDNFTFILPLIKQRAHAFVGKDTRRVKSAVDSKMIEQLLNFNYWVSNMGFNRYNDTNIELCKFQNCS
jgi:hypothetical protein